jgi:hypothetical protein
MTIDEATVNQQIPENLEKAKFWKKMVRETEFAETKDIWTYILD